MPIFETQMPPVLFAAFGSPWMLWGLAGASIPIIIHLLNRRKFREMSWAAMQFLLAAIKKNQRRIRIEQWILLAVRTALLLALAFAMARPALESLGVLDALGGRRHFVLAIDGSLSMAYSQAEASRFEQAREILHRVVKDARPGDAFSLIQLGNPSRSWIGAPAFAKDTVAKAIDELRASDGTLDIAGSLQQIDAALGASDIPRKELVLLTDLQQTSWSPPKSDAERLETLIARLEAKRLHALVVDLGAADSPNRALIDVETRPVLVTAADPVVIKATVQAFGAPFPPARAQLVVDGRSIAAEQQEVPALASGESAEVEFRHEFAAPGDHVIEVRIDDDGLLPDNRRRRVVTVREAVEVLLVDGDPKPGPFDSDTAFFAEAISPEPDSPGQPRHIRTRIITESQLSRSDLGAYDCVVLCNLPRVSRDDVDNLESYLKQGGGLVVFTGDQVQPDNYNRLLHRDGQGILPARIENPVGDPTSRESPFLLDTLAFAHPFVSDFAGQLEPVVASLTNVKTYRYHRLLPRKDTTARIALKLGNDPLIIEQPRERGRVVLIATTADRDWTDWPIHQSYPAVMEKIVLEAASGRFADRNVTVGQPLQEFLPAAAAGSKVTLTWPDRDEVVRDAPHSEVELEVESAGEVSQFRSAPTDHAGSYRATFGPPLPRVARFAANPSPAESNLERIDAAALQATLPGWSFDYASDWRPLQQSARSLGQSGELHRPFLWAVLALVLVETLLAWLFGRRRALGR